jgi:cytochrome P450
MPEHLEAPKRPPPPPIPPHVPAHLVVDASPYVARRNADLNPFSGTKDMIENVPPIFFANNLQGGGVFDAAWVITRHKDIVELIRNESLYSTAEGVPLHKAVDETFTMIPLAVDAPDHAKYRVFLNPWFAPKTVSSMEARIRATISELIDGFAERGECDVAYDFGRLFPVRVFLDLMGFPQEMLEQFLSWEYALLHSQGDQERIRWGMSSALAWLRGFIAETRAHPAENLTSYIVHGQIDGKPLTEDEIIGMVAFLWIAGLDTVAATIALMFRRLALEPDLQRRLREDPDLIPTAIEEFLRMQPVVPLNRLVKRDHEIHGVKIKKGDKVTCYTFSANYDPGEFEDPWAIRLDRPYNRHFTLGAGPHRCLGQHLARRELRIAVTEFLRRIPQFSLKPGAGQEAYPGLIAVSHVPLVWDAGAPAAP